MKKRTMLGVGTAGLACAMLIGIGILRAQNDPAAPAAVPASPAPVAVEAAPAAPAPAAVEAPVPAVAPVEAAPAVATEAPATPAPAAVEVPAPVAVEPPAVATETPATPAPVAVESAAAAAATPFDTPVAVETATTAAPSATSVEAVTNGNGKAKNGNGAGDTESVMLTTTDDDVKIPASMTNAEGSISINLDDIEMAEVVKMFTKVSEVNIIATPSNLQGRVTVNLTDVQWKPALEAILAMHNLQLYEQTSGSRVYSIVPKQPGQAPPMVVETIFLKYATVSNVAPVIQSLVADVKGTVSIFASKNAIVVKSTADNLGQVKQVVNSIDKLRDQVFIEAKFLELTDQAIKDLGINWQVLQGYQVGAGNLRWNYSEARQWQDSRTDTRTKTATETEWDRRNNVDTLTQRYDQDGNQDPAFYQSTEYQDLNGDGVFSGPGEITTTTTSSRDIADTIDTGHNIDLSDTITTDLSQNFAKTIDDMRTAVLGAGDFQVILSALKQLNGATVVSNPKIIVANEQPATIHVGQTRRPFIGTTTAGQNGIAPVTTYNPGEPLDLGVKLTVTPTVNTESNITVKIDPEITRLLANDTSPDGKSTYPIIATKRISTVFCLESGKTVAIGGLTETAEQDETTKIPLLGDIPLIGKYLFSHTHKEKSQTETIIFVTVGLATPESIDPNQGLPEDTELARRQMVISKAKRQQRDAELAILQEDSETTPDTAHSARVKERLLKRSK